MAKGIKRLIKNQMRNFNLCKFISCYPYDNLNECLIVKKSKTNS